MKINNEVKIGIMVTVVLVILAVLTYKTGEVALSKEGYNITVHFQMVDGISVKAPVMLNGFEVGHVEDITIVYGEMDTKMELTVWLDQKAKLREGAKAYVKNMGFMGEKYVGLTSGDAGGSFLPPGSNIEGQEPADLDRLLIDGKEVIQQVKEATTNINERLKKNEKAIDNIFTNLDTTMENMVSITANVDERLTKNEEKIDSMMTHLHSSSVNLDQFSYDLKMNPWKLMYRSKEKRRKSIDLLEKEKAE